MATIHLLEAVNLFMGDHDPEASNHLELEELKLPELSRKTVEHTPGGGVMSVGFAIDVLEKPDISFKLKGFNPDRLRLFGINTTQRRVFTAYGVIRNKRTGVVGEAKAIIEGRIAKVSPDSFSRGGDFGHEYGLDEVVSYALSVNGTELFAVDFFANIWRVGGVDQYADVNRILRVPGAG